MKVKVVNRSEKNLLHNKEEMRGIDLVKLLLEMDEIEAKKLSLGIYLVKNPEEYESLKRVMKIRRRNTNDRHEKCRVDNFLRDVKIIVEKTKIFLNEHKKLCMDVIGVDIKLNEQ